MNLQPISTLYNGNYFRSRLEARWAVFFDALGIEYEYEKEGYVLPDGTKYLPDFELKICCAEVKPKNFSQNEINKCKQLSKGCLFLKGVPDIETMTGCGACAGVGYVREFERIFITSDLWCLCLHTAIEILVAITDGIDKPISEIRGYGKTINKKIIEASRIAQTARFEHGDAEKTRLLAIENANKVSM